MPKFVLDEDMPSSTGMVLKVNGYDVKDIRDYELRGAEDNEAFKFSQNEQAVIIIGDRGFGNILRFALGTHFGIIVANFPDEMPTKEINRRLLESINDLPEDDFHGNLIIIEPMKIRIKRK